MWILAAALMKEFNMLVVFDVPGSQWLQARLREDMMASSSEHSSPSFQSWPGVMEHARMERCRLLCISMVSWYNLPSPSLPTLCNCVAPTLRLTADQYWTHSDLVPMPRATVYIPFLHLSYLPDPFSLTITGNYSFLV